MHQFDDRAGDSDLPGIRLGADLRRQHCEQGAEPLAARLEQMQHGLGHQLVAAAQFGGDHLLHASNAIADGLGENRIAEVHARHHGRRSPHTANIL